MAQRSDPERRFWVTLAFAGALHGVLAVVLRPPTPRNEARPREDTAFLEVSLISNVPAGAEDEEAEAHERGNEPYPASAEPAVTARVAPTRLGEAIAEVAPSAASAEVAPETVVPPAPSGGGPSELSAGRSGISMEAIGVGGENPFFGLEARSAVPSSPPVSSSEVPNPTRVAEQRLKRYFLAGMLEHDRAAGASRGGAVVTALRDAALLVDSPTNGHAEFIAVVDVTGLVTAVRPTRVSSNVADWRNVAARALKELSKKRLRVPAGAAGLEVRLALASKIQLPSGSTVGAHLHSVPLLSADGKRLSRLDLPPGSEQLPDPNDPGALGTPMLKQSVPVGGLDGDLADIGGAARRVVHVTITEERPL